MTTLLLCMELFLSTAVATSWYVAQRRTGCSCSLVGCLHTWLLSVPAWWQQTTKNVRTLGLYTTVFATESEKKTEQETRLDRTKENAKETETELVPWVHSADVQTQRYESICPIYAALVFRWYETTQHPRLAQGLPSRLPSVSEQKQLWLDARAQAKRTWCTSLLFGAKDDPARSSLGPDTPGTKDPGEVHASAHYMYCVRTATWSTNILMKYDATADSFLYYANRPILNVDLNACALAYTRSRQWLLWYEDGTEGVTYPDLSTLPVYKHHTHLVQTIPPKSTFLFPSRVVAKLKPTSTQQNLHKAHTTIGPHTNRFTRVGTWADFEWIPSTLQRKPTCRTLPMSSASTSASSVPAQNCMNFQQWKQFRALADKHNNNSDALHKEPTVPCNPPLHGLSFADQTTFMEEEVSPRSAVSLQLGSMQHLQCAAGFAPESLSSPLQRMEPTQEPTVPRSNPPFDVVGSLVCSAKDNVNKGGLLRGTVGSLEEEEEEEEEDELYMNDAILVAPRPRRYSVSSTSPFVPS